MDKPMYDGEEKRLLVPGRRDVDVGIVSVINKVQLIKIALGIAAFIITLVVSVLTFIGTSWQSPNERLDAVRVIVESNKVERTRSDSMIVLRLEALERSVRLIGYNDCLGNNISKERVAECTKAYFKENER